MVRILTDFHATRPKLSNTIETLASSLFAYYYRLLMSFANSLDPDQARQNVGPGLDTSRLTL